MSDLIERLRKSHAECVESDGGEAPGVALWREAADEIERLRRELAEARATLRDHAEIQHALHAQQAEARELAADVIARWSGRIDYYGHPVLDSDVAIRLHGFIAKGEGER